MGGLWECSVKLSGPPLDSCANVDILAKEASFLGKSLYLYAVTRLDGLFVATPWQANPAA